MNITDFTARKLASADRAAADVRLTHHDFRLLWLLLSAADRNTGIVRRKQSELARVLNCTTRGVQISLGRLISFDYLEPIGVKPGGYVSSYNVVMSKKAKLYSPSEKGERRFASENKKANSADQKGERLCKKGEPPFAHDPLISLDIPSRAREPSRPDGLGPLGAKLRQRIGPDRFGDWFVNGEAAVVSQTADTITLSVRTKFIADEIRNRFEADILAVAGTSKVEIVTPPKMS